MAVWSTYGLADLLLFSPQTYDRLLEIYNREIWPLQIPALVMGAAILFLVARPSAWRGRVVSAVLAACWLWIAWAYHWQRYAAINWAAPWFAAGFAVEAILLLWTGIARNRLSARPASLNMQRTGLGLYGFALLVYPFVNPLLGHEWARMELFGVTPDPTVMATLGILMTADGKMPRALMIVPALWCAVSGATLWALGAPNALVPPLTAALAVLLPAIDRKR